MATALRGPRRAALEPALGVLELRLGRERLGRLPDAVQPGDSLALGDVVAELLAELVLAHLQVETEQALEDLLGRRAVAPAALHRVAQALVGREDPLAD